MWYFQKLYIKILISSDVTQEVNNITLINLPTNQWTNALKATLLSSPTTGVID
jgi:hypothetical protein